MSWLPYFSVSIFLTFSLVLGSESKPSPNPKAEKTHRAYFVFGDSLVDNGNNNFLATTARAGLPPYGIDYPTHHPTGRFSNGLNLADIIGQRIGADLLLPYLSPKLKGQKLLNGANFASAGVGILNDTGIQFVNIIRMPSQLAHFKIYQRRVAHLIGIEKTKKFVNEALVLITCGGNDFVNNYYLVPFSPRSLQYKITDYVPLLISEYEKILMRLYKLGARKVVVTGAGPVGCVPAVLAQRSRKGECATNIQQAGDLYDRQLANMISSLNKKLGSDIFVSAQTKPINVFNNPKAFGFEESKEACCGQGAYNGLGICTPVSNLCPNRDKYVFWDAYHPTERANRIIVQDILNGTNI